MEAEFLQWLDQRLQHHSDVLIGIGDDAAVYVPSIDAVGQPAPQVVTTDLLCEGVHFLWPQLAPEAIGRKALAVNLSDMAAMAARPRAAVVSLLWPRLRPLTAARELYAGLLALAEEYQVAVVGGDTNSWSGELVISVTLMGEATDHGVLRRDQARPGDAILVTGSLGGSLDGHHCTFRPRVAEALQLNQDFQLHAGMDVSDGLSLDLSRLAQASKLGAELDLASIPIADAAHTLSRTSGKTALDHALADGEDFELLITLSAEEAQRLLHANPLDVPIARIGHMTRELGLWTVDEAGERTSLPIRGYLH